MQSILPQESFMENRLIIFIECFLFGTFGALLFMLIAFVIKKLTGKKVDEWKHYYNVGFWLGLIVRTSLIILLQKP